MHSAADPGKRCEECEAVEEMLKQHYYQSQVQKIVALYLQIKFFPENNTENGHTNLKLNTRGSFNVSFGFEKISASTLSPGILYFWK